MPERLHQLGDELLVVPNDGRLLSVPLTTLEWTFILGEVNGINAATAMEK